MDPIILAAATAVVGAMATDGWKHAQSGLTALWRRVWPEQADAVADELEAVRSVMSGAREESNVTEAEHNHLLVEDWREHLHELLSRDPTLTRELRELTERQLLPLLPPTERAAVGGLLQQAQMADAEHAVQAGRDAVDSSVKGNTFQGPTAIQSGPGSTQDITF
ncbi:hypothetical protein [Streptomyces sp. NPDC055099]